MICAAYLRTGLNNQLGFMVVSIGIQYRHGVERDGGACRYPYSLQVANMSMGAVLFRVGTVKASELGGLYKFMPLTTVFCTSSAQPRFPVSSVLRLCQQVDDHVGRRQGDILLA